MPPPQLFPPHFKFSHGLYNIYYWGSLTLKKNMASSVSCTPGCLSLLEVLASDSVLEGELSIHAGGFLLPELHIVEQKRNEHGQKCVHMKRKKKKKLKLLVCFGSQRILKAMNRQENTLQRRSNVSS